MSRSGVLPGPAMRQTVAALGAAGAIAALLGGLLTAGGYDAPRALRALWMGSLGSGYALTSATLVHATPLILAGLAVAVAFRAGVLNIGAEGQLLAGGAAAMAVGIATGVSLGAGSIPLMILAGAALGGVWAGIAAYLWRRFQVLEVISTIMLNFVAVHAVSYLVRGPLQEPLHIYPQTVSLAERARLPVIHGTRLHAGFLLALALALFVWWTLGRTAAGFRLRAVGANPFAARSAGLIDVGRTRGLAFVASGALAGVAGAIQVGGVTYALYENLSPGYGYTAIAVALLARLHPLLVIPAGIVFGALDAGASAMQRDAAVPTVLVSVVEAVFILGIVAAERFRPAGRR